LSKPEDQRQDWADKNRPDRDGFRPTLNAMMRYADPALKDCGNGPADNNADHCNRQYFSYFLLD
jgi:hypothetical protein